MCLIQKVYSRRKLIFLLVFTLLSTSCDLDNLKNKLSNKFKLNKKEQTAWSQGNFTNGINLAGDPPGFHNGCYKYDRVSLSETEGEGFIKPDGEIAPEKPFNGEFKLDYMGDFPRPSCESIGVPKQNSCFLPPSRPSLRNSIVLDPGHDDSSDGKRNTNNKIIHEGEMNMTTSLLIKDMLHRCYNAPESSVRLTRWPGEKSFGEYSKQNYGAIKATLGSERGARSRYTAAMLRKDPKSIFVSIHHNASSSRKADHVLAFHDGYNQNAANIAKTMAAETMSSTLKHYSSSKSDVKRHSRGEEAKGRFGIIKGHYGYQHVPRILMENFFMDSEQARRISSRNVKKFRLKKTIYGKNGKVAEVREINPEYKVADINVSAAIGNLRGLLKSYPCPSSQGRI